MKLTWMRTCTRSGCCSTNRTYVKQQRTLQNKKNKNNNINNKNNGPFRFTKKKMELKKCNNQTKIIPFQIKLFSPGEAVDTASSGPAGREAGWGTAQNKNKI